MNEYCLKSINSQSIYTGIVVICHAHTELEARENVKHQYPNTIFKLISEYTLDHE